MDVRDAEHVEGNALGGAGPQGHVQREWGRVASRGQGGNSIAQDHLGNFLDNFLVHFWTFLMLADFGADFGGRVPWLG